MPLLGTGMHLNAPILFWVAKDAYERIPAAGPTTTSTKRDALVSIVFSVASVEAFFNELPEFLADPPELLTQLPPEVITIIDGVRKIEIDKGSVEQKYLLAYSVLSGHACDKGAPPYQDFSLLIEARNGLMHMKPTKFSGETEIGGTLATRPSPRIMAKLRSKGILAASEIHLTLNHDANVETTVLFPLPWHDQISTRKAAYWACNTAADVVNKIFAILPDGPHKHNLVNFYTSFKRLS